MRTLSSRVLCDGFCFLEAPRVWGSGICVSDVYGDAVYFIDGAGRVLKTVEVQGHPSGLGQLPIGEWLVVVMLEQRLARLESAPRLDSHTDLAPYVRYGPNDMVVDRQGRCYIGSFGFNRDAGESPCRTELLVVDGPGRVRVAARDLWFPNGMAITADDRLVVAETYANRLTCFDIEPDGSLTNRRTFAKVDGGPDGLCADQAGGIWVASFLGDVFLRVTAGGQVTDRIDVAGRRAVSCNLGGDDLHTLFCLTAETTLEALAHGRSSSRIETVHVDIPGVRSP